MTVPGAVYLAASSHKATLDILAARALASIARRPARIAITYAAAGGSMAGRMTSFVESLFGGAKATRFTVDGEKDPMPPREARAIVDDADLVFVSGGDPAHGARLLVHSGADAWVRDAHARGAPCMGISAGAILLGAWWAEWPDPAPAGAPHDGGQLVPCMRVVPDLVVDCHAEEDRWVELALVRGMLMDRGEVPRLLGLPTGTGLVIEGDGALHAIGGQPFRL